ncbi:MAG: hypothetical protein ABIA93_02155 [Candidatus Woesearchaeota archaeon]
MRFRNILAAGALLADLAGSAYASEPKNLSVVDLEDRFGKKPTGTSLVDYLRRTDLDNEQFIIEGDSLRAYSRGVTTLSPPAKERSILETIADAVTRISFLNGSFDIKSNELSFDIETKRGELRFSVTKYFSGLVNTRPIRFDDNWEYAYAWQFDEGCIDLALKSKTRARVASVFTPNELPPASDARYFLHAGPFYSLLKQKDGEIVQLGKFRDMKNNQLELRELPPIIQSTLSSGIPVLQQVRCAELRQN